MVRCPPPGGRQGASRVRCAEPASGELDTNRAPVCVDERRMTQTARRGWSLLLCAVLLASTTTCRPERASVDQLYTTRMLGLSYLQRNQLPEAETEFKKLTEQAPDDPFGYTNLGLTYLQAGRFAEAEKELRRARELDPGNAEVGLALAKLYSLTGRPSDARTT